MPAKSIEAARKSRREWYYRNREHAKRKVVERRWALAQWYREHKEQLSCINCGESQRECLDFHHRNPKTKEINPAKLVKMGWSRERMLKELAKCDVLCANCHRKLHARDSHGASRPPKPS